MDTLKILENWKNIISPPEDVRTWEDIWAHTIYWSELNPVYAGNKLLAYMSEHIELCPKDYIAAATVWYADRRAKPQISESSIFPQWLLEANQYLLEFPLVLAEVQES